MKTSKKKSWIIFIMAMLFVILLNIVGYNVNKYYHKWVTSKPQKYCYEQYNIYGTVNRVLYVKKEHEKDSLIKYYSEIEVGKENVKFNFPIKMMPYNVPVYVLAYERDSSIAEVVCYYDWENTPYVKGYVVTKTLHDSPPPVEDK